MSRLYPFACALTLACLSLSGSPPRLELNQPIVADLELDASHHYRVELVAGEFTYIVVKQASVDVLLTIRDPNGERLMVDLDESVNPRPEHIYLIPERSGNYSLQASAVGVAPDAAHGEGRYTISVETQRKPTDKDRLLERAGWFQANALEEGFVNQDASAAVDLFSRSVELWIQTENFEMAASDLLEQQGYLRRLSRYDEVLEALNQAEKFLQIHKDPENVSILHSARGLTYRALGLYQQAFEEYAAALEMARFSPRPVFPEAQIRASMCLLLSRLGQLNRAKAECMAAKTAFAELGRTQDVARTMGMLAGILRRSGDFKKSIDVYEEALSDLPFGSPFAGALHVNLGRSLAELGQVGQALQSFEAALANYRENDQKFYQVYTMSDLALLLLDLGRVEEAEKYVSSATDIATTLVSKPAKLRALTTSSAFDANQGRLENAYAKSELAWAMLEELRSDPDDPDSRTGLLETEWLTSDLRVFIRMLKFDATQNSKWQNSALGAAEQARARAFLDKVEAVKGGTGASILTAEQMIGQLDPLTIQLQFHLGKKQSYLWRISHKDVDVFTLPNEKTISRAARDYFDLVTARDRWIEDESALSRGQRIQNSDRLVQEHGARLFDLLKLSQALAGLEQERLLLVADGALHRLPFAALPLPTPGSNSYKPMISRYEIVSVPSSSALSALRGLADHSEPTKGLAAFADPVFSANDPRLPSTVQENAAGTLPRLPATRQEVEGIMNLAPQRSIAYTGFDATKEKLENDIGDYRYLHFATHGIIDDNAPNQTALVLSQYQSDGSPLPGLVTIADVNRLQLSADLAVLSACRTARGREVRGEGVMGLSRSFMAGGVPRVLSSLWTVQDGLTHSLMIDFYQRIWSRQTRPTAALREAQLELWKQGLEPYYWAPFAIQGEWR